MKRLISIAVLLLVAVGCNKDKIGAIENLNNGRVEVIGHGGSGFNSPTNPAQANSWTAIHRAVDFYGVDGIEIDVQFTSDSNYVLYHDNTLEQSTNCAGCVNALNHADLLACKYNNNASQNSIEDIRVVGLEEVLAYLSAFSSPPIVFLDLKLGNPCSGGVVDFDAASQKLADLVHQYNAVSFVKFTSPNFDFNALLLQLDPAFRVFYDATEIPESINQVTASNHKGFTISKGNASKEDVKMAHDAGLLVYLFNARSQTGHTEALSKHPDGIMTDNIPLLQQMLRDML